MKLPTINPKTFAVDLLQGLGIALLFSLFIYTEHFGLTSSLVNSICALAAFYFLLKVSTRILASAGTFIGLLWFYWIGYSFEYYNVGWMTPFITLFFMMLYALFFGLIGVTNNPLYRAIILFGLSFVEPMDWNWLQMELPFVSSYFGIEKWQYALILSALSLHLYLREKERLKKFRYAPLLLLIAAVDFTTPKLVESDLKIKLYAPMLLQQEKWKPQNRQRIVNSNFQAITDAIAEGYDLVVLPESAFPLFLNREKLLISALQEQSHYIDIITGALYIENGLHYNVSYHFSNGEVTIAKKMVLVPFGEYIPLPEFLRSWVNTTFFDGASDFVTADKPSDFMVKGVPFRNAVCYEATCEEIYQGDPAYLIAISNNGWFYPSIEPTLQKLLMRFYTKKHHSIIYHSANMGGSGIVKGSD